MFYELLAGMNDWDKQELYLQGAETYYYLNQVHRISVNKELFSSLVSSLVSYLPFHSLNMLHNHFFPVLLQGGACDLNGKQDKQDFQLLVQCFETIGLHADQVSTVWAILSSILQLGNICFSSYEVCLCV